MPKTLKVSDSVIYFKFEEIEFFVSLLKVFPKVFGLVFKSIGFLTYHRKRSLEDRSESDSSRCICHGLSHGIPRS